MNSTILTWENLLKKEKNKKYFCDIFKYIHMRSSSGIKIYPERRNIFKSLKLTPIHSLKVVILGQDPYHAFKQADGLCFSVQIGSKIPPSLKNIFIEIKNNIPSFIIPTKYGCLNNWALQGVLLLNSILTVEEGKPFSHAEIGWELFTNKIITDINQFCKQIIFVLWGKYAKKKICLINPDKHIILTAPHPSPLSAHSGFIGCKHFFKINNILEYLGKKPINWNLFQIK